MMLVCRHCGAPGGCLVMVAIDAAAPGGQPAAAAAAPAPRGAQQPEPPPADDTQAPLCSIPRLATCQGCRQDITIEERPFARTTVIGRWHSECWTVHTDWS